MGEGDKPTSEDRPFWSLSPDDKRALWINFIGGLGTLIAGAAILGGAIGLGRLARHEGALWYLLASTVGAFAVVGFGVFLRRATRQGLVQLRSERWGVVERATVRFYGLIAAFLVLVWIGLAAGIK